METKVVEIKDNFYAPNKDYGVLAIEPTQNHKRVVRSIAKCPWHEEITESLMADHCKGIFHCFSCGVEGYLVEGTNKSTLVLQRED